MLRRWLWLLLCGLISSVPTHAATLSEPELRAAVIYKLLLFVEWPSQGEHFRFCYLEDGALATALKAHTGQKVHQSPLQLLRIGGSPEELHDCQAVLVEVGNLSALGRMAVASRTHPMLVIAEGNASIDRGAMIGLTLENGKIVFEIHLNAMHRSRLRASSRLLKLAKRVVSE